MSKPQKLSWQHEIKISADHLQYATELIKMLSKFLSMWDGHLGLFKAAQYKIDLSLFDEQPVHFAPCQAIPAADEVNDIGIAMMLELEVMELVQAEWTSPILFALKTYRASWFIVDYRKCNAFSGHNFFALRAWTWEWTMWELWYFFRDWTWTAAKGRLKFDKRDTEKKVLRDVIDIKFICSPLGLKNVPGTFQGAIDVNLSTVQQHFTLVYFENSVMYSKTLEAHITLVKHVLGLLCDADATIKLKQGQFFSEFINYLGCFIQAEKLGASQHTANVTRD